MTGADVERTVVIADDDADTRSLLAVQLRGIATVVGVAATWEEALTILATKRPDVLVTDERMPGDDQPLAVRLAAARVASPDTAVVVFCGFGDAVEARSAGAADFVRKPATALAIRNAVANATAGPATS